MKSMAWSVGVVGHFGLAVRDPKASARWWTGKVGLERQFTFPGGVAVGNDAVTIALHRGVPHPGTLGHMSFHLRSLGALREALADLKAAGVKVEDPGDEIGPEAPGSPNLGLWFHDPDGYRWELSVQNAVRKKRRATARSG
jgi:catechol 2,3-dioxygenase-like lactoylglutathione lyase family enzyme